MATGLLPKPPPAPGPPTAARASATDRAARTEERPGRPAGSTGRKRPLASAGETPEPLAGEGSNHSQRAGGEGWGPCGPLEPPRANARPVNELLAGSKGERSRPLPADVSTAGSNATEERSEARR